MSLTIDELKDKIIRVQEDLELLTRNGETGRKLEVLSEYKKYLEDELRNLKYGT